jgi:hypothetical protein
VGGWSDGVAFYSTAWKGWIVILPQLRGHDVYLM